jgi:ppGpp synthetase/RelA/SpoT-type nucleotidyltranferase
MSYATPKYSKKEITRAGNILSGKKDDFDELFWAFEVLSNFRACHNYPMNTFQATLRMKLKKIDQNALVAIRLKRAPSIIAKLSRETGMNLSRMQDIGGLRAIVKSVRQVNLLHANYKRSKFLHQLCGEKNYISSPKKSGYRGIHLVYKYQKSQDSPYNGLRVELQIRTKVQHAWATAVETLGTFINHSLKSSEGPDEWLAFFALAASAFAHVEDCPAVPGYEHLSKDETFRQTIAEAIRLNVHGQLTAYSSAVKALASAQSNGEYYLLTLDPINKTISYRAYGVYDLDKANQDYLEAERAALKGDGKQIVLVAASSITALKRAYPNYFLDTHEFLKLLSKLEAN